jgi:hypothetical protein
LTSVLTFARLIEISATSELEKNADRRMQRRKRAMLRGSTIIGSTPQDGNRTEICS